MKRSRMPWLVLAAAAVVVAGLLGTATARADGGGTTVKPFTVTYPDGSTRCAGIRIQRGGGHPLIRDLETCVTTLTVLAPGAYGIPTDTPWCSDFNGLDTCNPATRGRLTVFDNRNGTLTWVIAADYATP
jgi:hypothetical protein